MEALPVGNGRLGAMVFGGIAHERIQFNESTVWTGEPHDYAHKGASQSLGKIRELLWAGKQKEAEDLAMKEFMSVPLRQKAYQAFGDLADRFSRRRPASVTGLPPRSLDLDTGIATVEFTLRGRHLPARGVRQLSGERDRGAAHRRQAGQPGLRRRLKARTQDLRPRLPDGDPDHGGRLPDGAIRFEARLLVTRRRQAQCATASSRSPAPTPPP